RSPRQCRYADRGVRRQLPRHARHLLGGSGCSGVTTSTGCPVRKQMNLLKRLPGFSTLCRAFENHLVRIPRVTAAILSIAAGPPIKTGPPIGTAMHVDVGRLMGKLQLDTSEVSRAADDPPCSPSCCR